MSDSHHDSRIIHVLLASRLHLPSRNRDLLHLYLDFSCILVPLVSPLVNASGLLNDFHRNAMDDSDENSDEDVVAQSGP
jgi:hypothetical protein